MLTVITKAKQPLLYLLLGAGASVAIQRTIRLLTTNIDHGSKEDPSNSMGGNGGGVASSGSSSSSSSSSNSNNSIKTTNRERKKSALYTKTGDKGTSSLYNGERRLKTDVIFEVLGHQDELNCIIGIAREYCLQSQNGLDEMLSEIQSRLFDLGAAVATPVQSSSAKKKLYTEFRADHTRTLEEWIDDLDATCPPITNFVIPSGGLSSTHLNHARAVCRRAERAVIPLVLSGQVDAEVGRYLNRLSDYLFVLTRVASMREGRPENIWKKPNPPPEVEQAAPPPQPSTTPAEPGPTTSTPTTPTTTNTTTTAVVPPTLSLTTSTPTCTPPHTPTQTPNSTRQQQDALNQSFPSSASKSARGNGHVTLTDDTNASKENIAFISSSHGHGHEGKHLESVVDTVTVATMIDDTVPTTLNSGNSTHATIATIATSTIMSILTGDNLNNSNSNNINNNHSNSSDNSLSGTVMETKKGTIDIEPPSLSTTTTTTTTTQPSLMSTDTVSLPPSASISTNTTMSSSMTTTTTSSTTTALPKTPPTTSPTTPAVKSSSSIASLNSVGSLSTAPINARTPLKTNSHYLHNNHKSHDDSPTGSQSGSTTGERSHTSSVTGTKPVWKKHF